MTDHRGLLGGGPGWRLTPFVGTDHPFFPPLANEGEDGEQWLSVTLNYRAVKETFKSKVVDGVLGGNAIRLLRLDE